MALTHLAPAGTRISLLDLARWLLRIPVTASLAPFEAAMRQRFGVKHCLFISSGRAALFVLFETLRKLNGSARDEIIVPAYTCYSVPAAAIRAGLKVRVVDIDPQTLSYDMAQLERGDFSRVLAIVSANLYGIPNELPAIADLARRHGVTFIDDAAQSMDARIGARAAGTHGDVGLYSFDKGKNITSIQGGVLVTDSDRIADALRDSIARLPAASRTRTLWQAVQLFIYTVLLRPWLYWIPTRLPFLGLGATAYTTEYPVERYSHALAAMSSLLFRRLDVITRQRVATATRIEQALKDIPGLSFIRPPAGAAPVYLRFPVLARDTAHRERLLTALASAGIGAAISYPLSVADVAEIRSQMNVDASSADVGRDIAARLFTLPTHGYVTPAHITRMSEVCRTIV